MPVGMSEASGIGLALQKGERLLRINFEEPVFGLFADFPAICERIFPRLQPFGLAPRGLRLESAGGDLGEIHLRCEIPGVTARLWIHSLEVFSDPLSFSSEHHRDFSAGLLEAVSLHRSQVVFQSYDADLRAHGSLESGAPKDFLAAWAGRPPENLGPPLESGVVFYFGPHEGRTAASVTLDPSAMIRNGLFIRTRTVGAVGEMNGREVGGTADDFFKVALREVGLVLEESNP